ncbi:MAG: hypothetical protein U0528_09225 [Anaerolineae bacterium]
MNTTVLKEAGAKVVLDAACVCGRRWRLLQRQRGSGGGCGGSGTNADQVTFLTDVPGVLKDGSVITEISRSDVQRPISDGVITGGMAVKLNAAL